MGEGERRKTEKENKEDNFKNSHYEILPINYPAASRLGIEDIVILNRSLMSS